MTNIYSKLKEEHMRHRKLLAQIAQADDGAVQRELLSTFLTDVEAHAAAEEQSFYAALIEKADGSDAARHSVAEHKELDDMFEKLRNLKTSDDEWMTCFSKMRERYEHHIDEEEEEIFTTARQVLGKAEVDDAGNRFENRKKLELETRL